jgi:hypothetical protein
MDIPSNPAKIPWPTDTVGMTSRLKREGCRAIGRMSGSDDNFEVVMQVLRILAQHAKDKLEEQKDIVKGNIVNLAMQRADAQRKRDDETDRMENSLKSQAETLKNRIAALQKRKEAMLQQRIERKPKVVSLKEQRRIDEGIGGPKS